MRLKNGRHTYTELKNKYDRVIIKHNLNKDGTARTVCLLVQDKQVFVGVGKFSNRTFNFSKKKGRAIAQGRAELAASTFAGTTTKRVSQQKRREELSYIVFATEENTVEQIVANFMENDES